MDQHLLPYASRSQIVSSSLGLSCTLGENWQKSRKEVILSSSAQMRRWECSKGFWSWGRSFRGRWEKPWKKCISSWPCLSPSQKPLQPHQHHHHHLQQLLATQRIFHQAQSRRNSRKNKMQLQKLIVLLPFLTGVFGAPVPEPGRYSPQILYRNIQC